MLLDQVGVRAGSGGQDLCDVKNRAQKKVKNRAQKKVKNRAQKKGDT
jgi:hypothetical protein